MLFIAARTPCLLKFFHDAHQAKGSAGELLSPVGQEQASPDSSIFGEALKTRRQGMTASPCSATGNVTEVIWLCGTRHFGRAAKASAC